MCRMERMATQHKSRVVVERVMKILGERIGDGAPSLRELAALTGMSRFHLSRKFRRTAGTSLRVYVQGVRLTRAATLLLTTTDSATNVALSAGFYDLPHLDKAFRRKFGVTPREFRESRGERRGV